MRPNNALGDDEVRNPEDGPTEMKPKTGAMTSTDGTGSDPEVRPTTTGHQDFNQSEERVQATKTKPIAKPMPAVPPRLKKVAGKKPPAPPAVKPARGGKPPAKAPVKGRR